MILVECPRCHRPVAQLEMGGGRVYVVGTTYAENGDPGGVLTTSGAAGRRWSARTMSTDPGLAPGSASGAGRRTFVCKGRRHGPLRWVVTEAALTAGYDKAARAGRNRIDVRELR